MGKLDQHQTTTIHKYNLWTMLESLGMYATQIMRVHWNGNVFALMKFSSLAALEIVKIFWRNFHHWLHWKLSFRQLQVQPVMKISSKWWHFHFNVLVRIVEYSTLSAIFIHNIIWDARKLFGNVRKIHFYWWKYSTNRRQRMPPFI